jgi:hypothetical protein
MDASASVLAVVREESQRLSAADFPEEDFAGVRHSSSAEWALYGKLACRAFTRCWPTP